MTIAVENEKMILPAKEKNDGIFIIILKSKHSKADYKILGKTVLEWMQISVAEFSNISVDYDNKSEAPDFIKQYLCDAKFTVILNGNMPLLTKDTINHLAEYITAKDIKACKFSGGYAFNTEYLKTAKSIFFDSVYSHNEENFYMVENKQQLNYAFSILKDRIIKYHLNSGVNIINPATVEIEPEVEIDESATIYSGNVLKNKTVIKSNVILKEYNVIDNSIIEEGSCIAHSNIENSKIGVQVIIKPFCYINNSKIMDNVFIDSKCEVKNKIVKANSRITPSNSTNTLSGQ